MGEDEYEIIGVKKTHRIAQRPASTVVLCYERPVVKILSDGAICQAPAPSGVLERSIADVSFIAGMLVDKYEYHLPLHRQHLRLKNSGITLARSTLTNLSKQAIDIPLVGAALVAFRELKGGFVRYRGKADLISHTRREFFATINKYLRENGLIPSDRHSLYSLRHSFEDRLTAVEPPDKVQAAEVADLTPRRWKTLFAD